MALSCGWKGTIRVTRDVRGEGSIGFGPGWDRHDAWTLRFRDPDLERNYVRALGPTGGQRLRIACVLGIPLWLTATVLAPPFLGIPLAPIGGAAIFNCGLEFAAILFSLRQLTLRQVWAISFFLTATGFLGIAYGLGVDEATFLAVGAPTMMLNAVTGIALVRMAAWLATAVGAFGVILFAFIAFAHGTGGTAVFQAFLLIGGVVVATIASRYLEGAERTAFARGELVADLHRRIDRLFRQYLSPDVAQALVDDPDRAELGGEVVEVSVLFADLRGYTSYSEHTSPDAVVEMLNASFGSAVPAVFAQGGTIVQFVGDALMAIFNAPLRQPDHALRACRAALALQQAVGAADQAGLRPHFRVGINTGPALVGNIGSAELRNFSALGDTTNVAARLQTFAEEGTVVIGERTHELVRDLVQVRALGSADLRGKSSPTSVVELVSVMEAW